MRMRNLKVLSVTVAWCLLSQTVQAQTTIGVTTPLAASDSLVVAEAKGFDRAMVSPHLNLAKYRTFVVLEPQLSYSKQWSRDYPGELSADDAQHQRELYAKTVREALQNELERRMGWVLVEVSNAGLNTLVIQPSVSELNIREPELGVSPVTTSFVNRSASARLQLTLMEGGSGDLVAALSDFQRTRSAAGIGRMKRANRGFVLNDLQVLAERWAQRLGKFLAQNF